IVVLGAPLHRGALSPIVAERVAAAVALYAAGGARRVVATGGVTRGAPHAEADAIARALVAAGIPEDALVIEAASRTTADNARLTAAVLVPLGARRVWLVTQPFHARRAVREFRAAGLDPRAWHIADSVQHRDRARAVRWLVREYAAWAKLLLARR
ncbi:MAG TPA: YdcF family protein, partial [Kofleriaceae bacterium]|nr:YdcF family protein [Kofleriaceae bacterium]